MLLSFGWIMSQAVAAAEEEEVVQHPLSTILFIVCGLWGLPVVSNDVNGLMYHKDSPLLLLLLSFAIPSVTVCPH